MKEAASAVFHRSILPPECDWTINELRTFFDRIFKFSHYTVLPKMNRQHLPQHFYAALRYSFLHTALIRSRYEPRMSLRSFVI